MFEDMGLSKIRVPLEPSLALIITFLYFPYKNYHFWGLRTIFRQIHISSEQR